MVTDFKQLVLLCTEEIVSREYKLDLQGRILSEWELLEEWLNSHNITEFTEQVGYRYCDEKFGGHVVSELWNKQYLKRLRAVRMLTSYQKSGDFEFRSPNVEKVFEGDVGAIFSKYLVFLETYENLSRKTIENKKFYLYHLYSYSKVKQINLEMFDSDTFEDYFQFYKFSISERHNACSTLKLFFQYIYENGYLKTDMSVRIPPDNYKRNSKIPTTYTEQEIRSAIATIERSSKIGKRDYLIMLLAAEYGWRAKDITQFCFHDIDWEKNRICFDQHKTGIPVEFPLLASVGNAIIDYIKYGRQDCNSAYVILSSERSKWNTPLTAPTIHSIISQYLRKANVPNWENKKHGPHSLRHSMATNMLKNDIALPIIKSVLGHQTTESTKIYLKIDLESLRTCPLPMPAMHSQHYEEVSYE